MGLFDISDLVPDPKYVRPLKVVLLVIALYPFYLLTCYMAAKGFYAYEVFGSVAGLVAPVLFMAMVLIPLLLVCMVLIWGGVLLLLDRWLPPGPESTASTASLPISKSLIDLAAILFVNLFLLATFAYVLYTTDADGARRSLLAVIFGSLALGLVLVIGQHIPVTGRATGYGVLFLAALVGPILGGEYTTSVVEAILTQFRLGGVMVTVVPSDLSLDATPDLSRVRPARLPLGLESISRDRMPPEVDNRSTAGLAAPRVRRGPDRRAQGISV